MTSSESEAALARFETMLRVRVIDERLAALGESGAIGFLPRGLGREAALVGVLAALSDDDWVFPSITDWPLAVARGMRIDTLVNRVFGNSADPLRGHDAPSGVCAKALKIASASAPAATHLPHAVGVAWAARGRGEDLVTVALLDAAEIDAAGFHAALNFAGVMKTPTLFVCRVREGEPSAAEHAIAYGLAEAQCDGTDPNTVAEAIGRGVERARAGEGATVIDLLLGGDDDAIALAVRKLGKERETKLRAQTEADLASAIAVAGRLGAPDLASLFGDVYGELEDHLAAQLREARG
ncbi:MAG: hypothetical protein H6719_22605 [Sandaracinaceae bacterium]|nr:hypothetical protein [Sandaracinaceae bacterium]